MDEYKEAALNYDISYDWSGGYIWPPTKNYWGSKIRSRQSNAASVHPVQRNQQHSHQPKRQTHQRTSTSGGQQSNLKKGLGRVAGFQKEGGGEYISGTRVASNIIRPSSIEARVT